jgi:hypothetical protein
MHQLSERVEPSIEDREVRGSGVVRGSLEFGEVEDPASAEHGLEIVAQGLAPLLAGDDRQERPIEGAMHPGEDDGSCRPGQSAHRDPVAALSQLGEAGLERDALRDLLDEARNQIWAPSLCHHHSAGKG